MASNTDVSQKQTNKQTELLYDPEIPFLGIYPKEMKTLC